jgi:hypothetical protein
MKPPKGPFWAWSNYDGIGLKWHLCVVRDRLPHRPTITYLVENLDDDWYDDDWEEHEIVLVPVPKALE